MVKRSRLNRNGNVMKKKKRLNNPSIGSVMAAGGVVGMIGKGVKELKEAGAKIPEFAKGVTAGETFHEMIYLEKPPKRLNPTEAVHIRQMIDSGAKWDDIAKEYGYRIETMKQLVEEAEVENGDVRGFF